MAHELRLSYDGSYVYLDGPSATYCMIEEFTPTSPKLRTKTVNASYLGDGGESIPSYRNVGEILSGAFKDSTVIDNVVDTIRQVELWLRLAMQRQRTGAGERVYLEIKIDTVDTSWWRTEILGGQLLFDDDLMKLLGQKLAPFTLRIDRRFFWEGALENLTLTSEATTTPGTTVDIYNDADDHATGSNWVQIAASNIENGVIPAPVNIRFTHDEVASAYRNYVWLANNVFNDPANFDPYLLSSESDGGAGSWTGAVSTWTEVKYWNLASAQIADCAGYFMRILYTGILGATATNVWCRAVIKVGVGTTGWYSPVWVGDAVHTYTSTSMVVDLGAMPIPPAGYSEGYKYVRLSLEVIAEGTGAITPDFIQLMPTTSSRYAVEVATSYAASQGDQFRDYGIDGRIYVYDPGDTAEEPVFIGRGDPVQVWPNMTQRLYILYSGGLGFSGVAGNKSTVEIDYRPRRLTV